MRNRLQIAFALLALVANMPAAAAELGLTRVWVPAPHTDRPLAATVVRPPGNGPFPLIVLNHGAPYSDRIRAGYGYWDKPALLGQFVRRGFAVIVPVRRGFGATGGRYAEDYGGCVDPDFRRSGLAAADDIIAAVRYAARLPFVDGSRIILVGQSAGGFSSIAAASRQPRGVIAVANFSGGRAGNPEERPGQPCLAGRMANTIEEFAHTTEVPVLWHYVENDLFFSPAVVRQWFSAFRRGGGTGTLLIQPAVRSGHSVLLAREGAAIWGPVFDRFLADLGLR